MRIYELLFEKQENNIEVIAKYIANNCQPFLNQITTKTPPLCRGQSERLTPVCNQLFKSITIAKRTPLTSSKKDHKGANDWFIKKFGIGFRRDHIMFASSNRLNASQFGVLYIVIPINNFKFCWSPKITDLYCLRDDNQNADLEELLNNAGYQITDLRSAIMSGNEVMIHCKEYFLLNVKKREYKQIIQLAKEMI